MSDIDPWVRCRHLAALYLIMSLVGVAVAAIYYRWVVPLLIRHRFPIPHDLEIGIITTATVVIANGIYRLLGLSLASRMVESRARVNLSDVEISGIPEVVEIDTPSPLKVLIIVIPPMLMLFSLLMCCGGPNALASFGGLIGIPLFGVLTLMGFSWLTEPQVRATGEGILGTHTTTLGRRFVPWDEVATCEITRIQDQLGGDRATVVIFKDGGGKVRLNIALKSVPKVQIDGLIKYLRAVLPKAKFDPLDEL